MAVAKPPSFDEVYAGLFPEEGKGKVKPVRQQPVVTKPAPAPASDDLVVTPTSEPPSFDQVYNQLFPEKKAVPGATVAEIKERPRSAGAPPLAPVGVGTVPPPVVRPGTPPSGPTLPGKPDYAQERAGIQATAADLAAQKPELDREGQALDARFQALKRTEQEIRKGLEIKRTHPEEWNPTRDLALQVKVSQYDAARQQFTAEQAPFQERQKAYQAAVTSAQAREAQLQYAPATAKVPVVPTFAPGPFPEEQLFLGAEDVVRRTPKVDLARFSGAMQHQALSAGRYHLAAQKQLAYYQALGPQLTAAAKALEPLQAQLVAGKLSPSDERRVVQAGVKLQAQLKAYNEGFKNLQARDERAQKFLAARLAAGFLPHAGALYPEELAEQQGHPQGWLEQHVDQVGNLIRESYQSQKTAAQKAARVILGGLMVTGESPPLPANPGTNALERKHYRDRKNEVWQYVQDEDAAFKLQAAIAAAPARTRHTPPDFAALNARLFAFSKEPWALQLLPILRAQLKAKNKADQLANVQGAAEKDARSLLVSTVWSEFAGLAALGLRSIPAVARILAEPIFGAGAKPFLARAGARLVTHILTTGTATGTFGAAQAGATAYQQGKGLKESAKRGAAAFPGAFAFGAALATGEELLNLGAAGAGLGYRRFVKYAHEPVAPGTQSGLLTLPEEYNPGPPPSTLAAGRAQIKFLEEARTQAEAELSAVVAAGEDAAAARAAAPRAVKSLLGPTTTPESLTAAEIRNAALQFVDGLNSRIIQTRGLLPGLAELPLATAPDVPQLLTREEAEQLAADRAAAAERIRGRETPPEAGPQGPPQGPRPVLLEDEPFTLPPTREEARGGRPPSPGGYEQAPPGLGAGPAVSAPAGTPVPFRYQTPAILAGLLNDLQQDGSPQSLATLPVVQGYILRAHQFEQGRAVPPTAIDAVTRAFSDPKEPARIAFQAISRAAGATQDPDLAARLAAAAQEIQHDFGGFIASTLPDAQDRDTGVDLAPPFVSPYRTLSGAQRQALDPDVRRALLVQDIANSTRVLHPGTAPFFTLPGSTGQLARQADNLFRLAQRQALQTEVAQSIPQPGAQVAVEGGQPQPSTIPGAQVGPEEPFQRQFGRPETFTRTQPSPVATEQRGKLSAPAPRLSRRHHAIVKAIAPQGGASRVSLQRRFRLNRSEAGNLLSELQGQGLLGQPGPNGQAPLLLSPEQLRALTPPRPTVGLQVAPRGPQRAESDLAAAARLVADSGRASAPGLQRRLRISPEEAEALLKELEKLGVVSAPDQSGRRRVLMNHAQAEDAVSHAETLARRSRGGYVPVPTPAPNVTITRHEPKALPPPKKKVEAKPPEGEKPAPEKPEAPKPGKTIRLRSKSGKTVVEFVNGKGTLVEVAPGLNQEVGDTYPGTAEGLKAKGWTEERAPEGEGAPKTAAPEPSGEKAALAEKSKEERARGGASEPEEAEAPAEPASIQELEALLQAKMPDLTPEERASKTDQEKAAHALGQFAELMDLVPDLAAARQEAAAGAAPEKAAFREVLERAEGTVQGTAEDLAGGFTKGEIRDILALKPKAMAPSPESAQEIERLLREAGWTPERILEAGEAVDLGLHGPPAGIAVGNNAVVRQTAPLEPAPPEPARLPPPSAREKPPELTEAEIAAVKKAGFADLKPGQRVGLKDLFTQFVLKAPEPRLGPYAWTAEVTERGFTSGVGDRPIPLGATVFVNFAENPKRYVLDPGPRPAPPPPEPLTEEEKVAPKWAQVGARFEAKGDPTIEVKTGARQRTPTEHIYELVSHDPETGTWMAQIVALAPEMVKQIQKATNPTFVPLSVGRLDMFTNQGLQHYEPLPGFQIKPRPAPQPVEGPQTLPETPVPVTEERNDDLPTAPPPETQVKERGQKPPKAKRQAKTEPAPAPEMMDIAALKDPRRRGEPGYYGKAEAIAPDWVGHNPHTGEIVRVLEPAQEPGHWRVLVTTSGSQRGKGPISTVGDERAVSAAELADNFLTVEKAPTAANKNVIASYNDPEAGVTSHVAKVGDQFSVAVQDDESGEFVPSVQLFPDEGKARTAARKAVAEPDPVTIPYERKGKETEFIAGGKDYQGHWAVVDAGEPITSHDDSLLPNPVYPQQYQPRDDRDDLASQNQVLYLMGHLDGRQLGENPLAAHGAPVVAPSLVVESGNGRMIAIRRLYALNNDRAKKYRTWVLQHVEDFKISRRTAEKMQRPVLVRVRTQKLTEAERLKFVQDANAKETLAPSAKANAKFLAARFTPRLMEWFKPGANLDLNAAQNSEWVGGLLALLPPNDLGDMIVETTTGGKKQVKLSRQGLTLATDALFYYAYGDEGLLAQIALDPEDNPVKKVTGAMLAAAGIWSTWRDKIKTGHAYDLDVTPDLLVAVHHMAEARTRKPAGGLIPDEELPPLQETLYQALVARQKSARALETLLADIADEAMQVGDPFIDDNEPALFDAGEKELPTTREIVEAALRRQGRNADRQTGVLPETEAGPGPAEGAGGPEARATTTGPLGGGDREPEAVRPGSMWGYPPAEEQARWATRLPEVAPYLHAFEPVDLDPHIWVKARLADETPVIWPLYFRDFEMPSDVVQWMAEDGRSLAHLFHRLAHRLLTKAERGRLKDTGLLTAPQVGGFNLQWRNGNTEIYLNPFSVAGENSNVYREQGAAGESPQREARRLALVMLHEIAHFRVKEEGGTLWDEMDRMFEKLGAPAFARVIEAIRGVLTEGGKDEFSQKYQKARAAYAEAVGDGRRGSDLGEPGRDAGAGPERQSRVTRGVPVGEGRAGRDQGRGPTARATSVTPGGSYPDPRQEAQYREAQVPEVRPDEGEWDRFARHLRELVHGLTREFPELKAGGQYAQLMSLLHGALRANQMGKEEAKRRIDAIYRPLSAPGKELYDRALNIFDMREDQVILAGRLRELHKSWTEAEIAAEVDRTILYPVWVNPETGKEEVIWTAKGVRDLAANYEGYVAESPHVARAIAARRSMVKEVGDKIVYWVERATGRKIELPREDYIHRMVLEYVMGPEALAKVGGPSKRGGMRTVSRGFMMARHGTTLAHNTHYIAREMEWLSQALADIPLYQLWTYLAEAFDVAGDATAIAKAANFERLFELLEEEAAAAEMVRVGKGEGQPITAESIYRGWSAPIAQAFSYYGQLATLGQMTRHPDGRFDKLIEQLADAYSYEEAARQVGIDEEIPYYPRPISEKMENGIHEYGAWILQESQRAGEGLPGSGPAAAMFKAVAARRKKIQETLGHQIEDADDVVRGDPRFKDHVWIQPSPGRRIFTKLMVVDRIAQELNDAIVDEAKITRDDLRSMPVLGGPKLRLLVPKVIAATLEGLDAYQSKNAGSQVLREITRPIKMAQLYNPIHTIDFFLRKGITDVQAMILGGRGWALKEELVPAFKMVGRYVLTGQMPELTPDAKVTLPSGEEATVTFNDADRRREFWEFLKFGALHQTAAMASVERDSETPGEEKARPALPPSDEKKANTLMEQLAELLTTGMIKTRKGRKVIQDIYQLWGPQAITILDGSMRFAVYMSSFKEMAATDTNRPKNVGFAHWQEVAAIEGVGRTGDEQLLDQRRRRAWLIADEMMVAYGKTPPALVALANHGIWPWVRFEAQNLRRTLRLVANPAWEQRAAQKIWLKGVDDAEREWIKEIEKAGGTAPPRLPRKRGGTGGGGGKGGGGGGGGQGPEEPPDLPWHWAGKSPRVLANQASLILAIYSIARLWQWAAHWLVHGLERDLPPKVREEAHAIIGLDPWDHDKVMALVRLSAFDDVLAISDPLGAIEKVKSGQWSPAHAVMEVALHNPTRELLRMQGQGQELLDLLKHQGSYPDPLNPQPKEADLGAVFDVIGYGGVYRWALNVRHLSGGERWFQLIGIHEFGRLESNYYETRDLAREYLDAPKESPGKNQRSAALYNFFQSARHGDRAGMDYFLASYVVLGGKPAGLREAVKGHDPFLSMNDDQAAAFLYKMDPDQRARALGAYMHYKHEVDAVTGQSEPLAREILKIGNDMERLTAIRQEIRLELLVNNPIREMRDRHPELDPKIEAAGEAAQKALHPELPVGAE